VDILTKRAYDEPSKDDGIRILVDRLWPRGIKKETLRADIWMKNIAPSTELRKWFRKEDRDWKEFKRRYAAELDQNPEGVAELRKVADKGRITLLYSVKDPEYNHAVVLKEYLAGR
jgi:uncharacterized protein YeaO (DUF488 family)